ncbi:MAG TPA: hypothetical protein VII08_22115 [Myxococcales bacterium]
MFVLATGTFTDPSKLGPYLDQEIAQIHANRDKGLIVSQYLRADGKGVFVVWQVGSIDEARKRAGLTFSKKGLMTVEFTELNPF